jgi:hypothetical protein
MKNNDDLAPIHIDDIHAGQSRIFATVPRSAAQRSAYRLNH